MMNTLRFGAMIPIIGEHNRAYQLAHDIAKAAQGRGLNTAIGAGPQEPAGFDPASGEISLVSGVTVYTGKDADNFQAYQTASAQAADADQRLINKQLKELGHPPDPQTLLGPKTFWKHEAEYERRTMIWNIFNPHPRIPSPYDFNTSVPENYSEFKPVDEVEKAFKDGALDISG